MRILLLSIISFILCINTGHSQWMVQNSGTTAFLKSACFLDENTGWVCAEDIVLKTTNGGDNWTTINVPGYHSMITFVNENYGWVCGQNGKIQKTTDGGQTWETQNSGTFFHLNDIKFYDQNTGFATGFGKTLIRTTDGGNSWINVITPGAYPTMHALYIKNANEVYATADFSYIYKSNDGGQTWDSLTVGMENPFFFLYFLNADTGWALGCCGMYFKTTDAGASWTPERYLTPGYTIYSAQFINNSTGWCSADAGYILRTTDGGVTWDSLASGTTNDLRTIQFVNDSTGWVIGSDGLILKTTNGGGQGWSVGIQQTSSEIPGSYSLKQNYPNPFNPSTTIGFNIPKLTAVELTVYDLLGREVSKLVKGELTAGSYEYMFDASGLNSGIYFYTLWSGDFSETRRMVLIK
jgi:photosystem II stability/assembly factor-like uncharacterized protein